MKNKLNLFAAMVAAALVACGGGGGGDGGTPAPGSGSGPNPPAGGGSQQTQWTGTREVGSSATYQVAPALARLANGHTAVAWLTVDGGSPEVRVTQYNRAGNVSGTQAFDIQPTGANTVSQMQAVSISAHPAGGYAVAWCQHSDQGVDNSGRPNRGWQAFVQRVDASGQLQGAAEPVHTQLTHACSRPQVTYLAGGQLAVTMTQWTADFGVPGFGPPRCVVRVSSGGAFQTVGDFPADSCQSAALPDGDLALVVDEPHFMSQNGVYLRRFDAAASAFGDAAYIAGARDNSDPAPGAFRPGIAATPDGNVAVAWVDAAAGGLVLQRFATDGSAIGGRTQLTGSTQTAEPRVAVGADGSMAVVWLRANQANQTDIVAQTLDASGAPNAPARSLGFAFTSITPQPGHDVMASEGRFVYGWQPGLDQSSSRVMISRE